MQLTCLLWRNASQCTALVISFHELNTCPANGFPPERAEEGRSPFTAAKSSSDEGEPMLLFKSANSSSDVQGCVGLRGDVVAGTTRDGTLNSELVADAAAPPSGTYK